MLQKNNLFDFIKSPNFIFNVATLFIFLAFIWISCYSFVLFPWEGRSSWWHIPHLATIVISGILTLYVLGFIETKIKKLSKEPE
jgi:hypothetical protein